MTTFWKTLQHIANISLNGDQDTLMFSFFCDNFSNSNKDTYNSGWLPLRCAATCPNIDVDGIQALSESLLAKNRKDSQ